MLSAYEFAMHYQLKQAKHPFINKKQKEDPDRYEAELTEKGIEKVSGQGVPKLEPGKDYVVREEGGHDWLPLGHGKLAQPYRHDWIMQLRPRPYVPVIFGAQSSRTTEEQAMRILILYFPWVNDVRDASSKVPFINNIWQPGMQDWTEALLGHVRNVEFLTQEVKCLVMNFLFAHCLPRQTRLVNGLEENSDNEDLVDDLVDLQLEGDDLLEATLTHVRGNGNGDPGREDPLAADGTQHDKEPEATTKLYDMTMQMFELSGKIWLTEGKGTGNEAARQRHAEMQASAVRHGVDHDLALAAAKASDKAARAQEESTGLIGPAGAAVEAGGTIAIQVYIFTLAYILVGCAGGSFSTTERKPGHGVMQKQILPQSKLAIVKLAPAPSAAPSIPDC